MSIILYKGVFFPTYFLRKQPSSELIKTGFLIFPSFLGTTVYIYDGHNYLPCFISINKIGLRFNKGLVNFKKKFKFKDFFLK